MSSVSLIIISGFLGSGKTTFVKRIIDENKNIKFGFIQNEFSEDMGIEKPLFVDNDTTIYELPSGCLCCSSKSQLAVAIESLVGVRVDLECILIEASGVANVIELANSLWVDTNSKTKFRLSTIVVLVDGIHFLKTVKDPLMSEIAINQISTVSRIIITKKINKDIDLENEIKRINSNCKIYYINKFNTNELLEWDDFSSNSETEILFNNINNIHLNIGMSKLITINTKDNEVLSLHKVNEVVAILLWTQANEDYKYVIYRCKAIFTAIDDTELIDDNHLNEEWIYNLQGIGDTYEITPVAPAVYNKLIKSGLDNKFLFITNDEITQEKLHNELEGCKINKI